MPRLFHCPAPARFALAALLACLTLISAQPAQAESSLQDLFDARIRKNIDGALAVIGIAAVPAETASTLVLNTGNNPDRTYDFQSAQLGGGFRLSDDIPIYMEGYLGWNRYDPVLLFSDTGTTSRLPFRWSSFAATGGIGYEFDLTPYLILRPQLHVTLGRVQTDISVGTQFVGNKLGIDTQALKNGGVTAGGLGGSVALAFNRRWDNDWEADAILRHTQIMLEPIAGNKDLAGHAEAITTTLWTRLRQPTGQELWNRPIRWVYELSGSLLPGDQGEVLATDWLAQIGAGVEVDFAETWVPWITTTRLVARYTRGETLEGFSVGLAASF
ncbi:MAG: autotransporter outer membrane beta-barrel domain-containing protein [Mangrovicoccus sp.]